MSRLLTRKEVEQMKKLAVCLVGIAILLTLSVGVFADAPQPGDYDSAPIIVVH